MERVHRVAREIGADTAFVIAATHGKRAIDNLARFRPHLLPREVATAIDELERSILFYADACAQRRLSSTPSVLSDSDSGPGSGSCSLPSAAPGSATLREHLVTVSELVDGIAVTLSVALASGDGPDEWELELEAVEDSK